MNKVLKIDKQPFSLGKSLEKIKFYNLKKVVDKSVKKL